MAYVYRGEGFNDELGGKKLTDIIKKIARTLDGELRLSVGIDLVEMIREIVKDELRKDGKK